MVLSGPYSDSKSYIDAQWDPIDGNLGTLPPFVQERLHFLESHDLYNSTEYQAINSVLATFFTLRTTPVPDCFMKSRQTSNHEIYVAMQGQSEFTMSGTLSDFNTTGRLSQLSHIPVLLTHGTYDTMRPSIVRTMQRELGPLAERVLFTRSGHVSMIDEPGKMNKVIVRFLNRVEQRLANNPKKTSLGSHATPMSSNKKSKIASSGGTTNDTAKLFNPIQSQQQQQQQPPLSNLLASTDDYNNRAYYYATQFVSNAVTTHDCPDDASLILLIGLLVVIAMFVSFCLGLVIGQRR